MLFWRISNRLIVLLLLGLPSELSSHDPCRSLATCGECIRMPNCAWCSETPLATNATGKASGPVRCQPRTQVRCSSDELLVDPQPEYKVTTFTPRQGRERPLAPRPDNIQLRPQRSSLTNVRIGEPFNISLQFVLAKDYPLDLYYLMDVSYSMGDDKMNLVKLAGSLADAMHGITKKFKIGFGSFIDKNVVPFVERTGETCAATDTQDYACAKTYSFQNQLQLSENVDNFVKTVDMTQIVKSFDPPEGGFDALVQAIVCQEQIGWRNQSRRVIVLATDEHSHLAGNGKLGGVLTPNDGACHLDSETEMYTEAETMDYPSIGQVSQLVKDRAINLIFAVTDDRATDYEAFTHLIEGSRVGRLSRDSLNIVDLLRDIYQNISTSVVLSSTADNSVKLRYFTSCMGSVEQESNRCDGLKAGDAVNFTISIEVTECPESDQYQSLIVYPVGVNEAMTLNYKVACNCPCENPENAGFVRESEECNFSGSLQCGVCHCDPSHSGQKCECDGDRNQADLESQCKATIGSDTLCSGLGDCFCGECTCHGRPNPSEVISGKHCECDNFSCDRSVDGKLCSNNGKCECKKCQCYSGWEGMSCDCKTSTTDCTPLGGDTCSGHGECKCGRCECSANAVGKFCEDCPTCPSRCDEFVSCVQCRIFQTGPYMANNKKECNEKCIYSIVSQNETAEVELSSDKECTYENPAGCAVKFIYGFDPVDGAKRVRVQSEPVCPQEVPVLAIGLGLLGTIIIAGLLLVVIYKLLTYLYDKREYARFISEQKRAKWNKESNPLYVDPTATFRNPTYGT